MKHLLCLVSIALPLAGFGHAGVTIDGGLTEVYQGCATVQVPVQILGGDPLTDLVGAVEIPGATITAVSYEGSIWETAPGGTVGFFPGFAPPRSQVDPNLSLLVPGEAVLADGILFTLTVDVSGLGLGDHPVKLAATSGAGSTAVYRNGVVPATTVTNGTIRIVKSPLDLWRELHFPAAIGNAGLESTVWGDDADPDQDGLKNLLEFAIGTDPNDPSLSPAGPAQAGVPQLVVVDDGGQDYLALQFTRRVLRPCHEVKVEASGDLQAWDGDPGATIGVGTPTALPGGEFEWVTRRLPEPVSAANSPRFLRLKVTRPVP
jgi:hypothetical protein